MEDLEQASGELVQALKIRMKYQRKALQFFPKSAEKFITGEYPDQIPKPRPKPEPSKNLFKKKKTINFNAIF